MGKLLVRLIADDHGQDLIEYAFLVLFLAFAVLIGIQEIPSSLNAGYSNIGSSVGAS
jgi:Flp pilus assembly pilin Flp